MVSAAAPSRPAAPAGSLALLVVEDSPDDYELVVARLASAGRPVYSVRVQTAAELSDALTVRAWSAVIADHRLPGFTSLQALAIVRAQARDLPFLIVSGAIGEEVAVEAMRAGADDYVMKDNLGRLEPALAHAIDAAETRRRQREAEEALTESEERFRALTANLPGMVYQLQGGPHGVELAYVSDGSCRLLGLTPAELVADPARWLSLFVPADAAVLRTLFQQADAVAATAAASEPIAPVAPPRSRWIEFTAQLAERGGSSVRFIEFTARARQLGSGRWLWDGIATDVTPQKRAEAELRASREELRELASHQTRVREEERAAIARELHDDIGSTLTGVKFDLAWLMDKLARDDAYRDHLQQMDQLVDSVITSSTRIMLNLRPGILDEDIVAALEWLARSFEGRTGVTCTFDCVHEDIPLEPDWAIVVFRVCQEALNNIAKHAGATVAGIVLEVVGERLVLEVRDDGCGVTPDDLVKRDRFGLRGMRERAIALGGSVEVASAVGGGTVVRLRLPLTGEPAKSRAGPQLAA